MTLRRGRVVDADMRNLSFVHHVPSNSEEHEKDSDDDPNIDARHEGMKRRSKLIGKAFCCCEVTVGFSRNGRGNRTPRPELRRCGRKILRPHTPSYLAPLRWGLLSCVVRAPQSTLGRDRVAARDPLRPKPSGRPSMKAFCLKAPTVRFVNLAIVFAGVFSREWFFNSRKSSFVHSGGLPY